MTEVWVKFLVLELITMQVKKQTNKKCTYIETVPSFNMTSLLKASHSMFNSVSKEKKTLLGQLMTVSGQHNQFKTFFSSPLCDDVCKLHKSESNGISVVSLICGSHYQSHILPFLNRDTKFRGRLR